MPFDPSQPAPGSPLSSLVIRNQLNALHDGIASVPAGPPGAQGPQGEAGPQGDPGPTGEVSQATLDAAIAGTASNPTSVEPLALTAAPDYDAGQLQAIANKLDELLGNVKRV